MHENKQAVQTHGLHLSRLRVRNWRRCNDGNSPAGWCWRSMLTMHHQGAAAHRKGRKGLVTVPTGFCTIPLGGGLHYSLSFHKQNLPLPFHPEKGNCSASYCSMNYKGLPSGEDARDWKVITQKSYPGETVGLGMIRDTPVLRLHIICSHYNRPISHYPGHVTHGAWRTDWCFTAQSACCTSDKQKAITPETGIGPLCLWPMPES